MHATPMEGMEIAYLHVFKTHRSRTSVMQVSNVTGRKLMSFTREEFEGLVKISDDIRREIVLLEKRS